MSVSAVTYSTMGEKPAGAEKEVIVEALALAFTHADLPDVSAAGLRSALEVQWDDLFDGDALDLGEVVELLPGSPGSKETDPPLCRIKTWEEELGVEMRLPERLAGLATIDLDMLAGDCSVPNEELEKVLRKSKHRRKPASKKRPAAAPSATGKSSEKSSRRSKVMAIAVLLALSGFGTAGFFLWRELGPSLERTPLPASLGDIPAEDLARRGAEAGAVLTDPGWLDQPAEIRRRQMKDALRGLRGDGIEVLFLRDDAGAIRATAQVHENDEGRRIVVTFR